jgi:hypothetical protein
LSTLRLAGCAGVNDAVFQHIARIESLEHLDLAKCKEITAKGFSAISSLRNLRSLDVAYTNFCYDNVKSIETALPDLGKIVLRGCQSITDESIGHLISFPVLHTFDVIDTNMTSAIFQILETRQTLTSISFGNVPKLNPLLRVIVQQKPRSLQEVHLPHFLELRINDYAWISDENIQHIVDAAPSLELIELSNCTALTDASLDAIAKLKFLKSFTLGKGNNFSQNHVHLTLRKLQQTLTSVTFTPGSVDEGYAFYAMKFLNEQS